MQHMKPEDTVDYHIKTAWHAISRMYNQQAAKYKATMSEGFVLLNIKSDEGTPATKIAPLMGLESRSLTRILKRLEDEGMIYKKKDPNDGRSVRIFLTDEGEKKRKISADTVKSFNVKVRSAIPENKLNLFFDVMSQINRLIEEVTKNKSLNNETKPNLLVK